MLANPEKLPLGSRPKVLKALKWQQGNYRGPSHDMDLLGSIETYRRVAEKENIVRRSYMPVCWDLSIVLFWGVVNT
jgi:hypothetical protein